MSAKATLPWTASESIHTLPLNGRYVCLSTLPKGLKQQAWGVLVSQLWALVILTLYSSGSDPPALEVLPHPFQ